MKADQIYIHNLVDGNQMIHCERCGRAMLITLPLNVDSWITIIRQFQHAHSHCSPVEIPTKSNESVAAQLAAIVREIYEQYQVIGYHTFAYWMRQGNGESFLADALADFVEEHYPAEWSAAWEPYANDTTVMSRDPLPAGGQEL